MQTVAYTGFDPSYSEDVLVDVEPGRRRDLGALGLTGLASVVTRAALATTFVVGLSVWTRSPVVSVHAAPSAAVLAFEQIAESEPPTLTEAEEAERLRWQAFVEGQRGAERSVVSEIDATYSAEFARHMPLPITTIEDGEIVLEWNTPALYLEVEVRADHDVEWFFRDTQNQQTLAGSGINPGLLEKIARFHLSA